MRFRARQRVPVWLQMIVVVVCATAMVIAADAEDYCGETTAWCIGGAREVSTITSLAKQETGAV